ncbi:serine/threonine-protein kinase [Kitasatospora sp. NPDC058965]|uniref:serine/threonine-protein kinase n=1 Tax=Kitasatospora sp. NPDC058965 TaxID=3346682 RepID=UPI0036AF46E7
MGNATGPQQFGWFDNPAWGQLLVWLLLVVVVLRLVTWALLVRAQRGFRYRLVSSGRRREIGQVFAADTSRRQEHLYALNRAYPSHRVAAVLDVLVPVLVIGGLGWLLHIGVTRTYTDRKDVLSVHQLLHSPPWPMTSAWSALWGGDPGGAAAVLVCAGLTAAWLGAWFRTRYLLLSVRMPSGTWEGSRLRRLPAAELAVRAVAVLLLPAVLIAMLTLWQALALLAARRLNAAWGVVAPRPIPGTGATAAPAPVYQSRPAAMPVAPRSGAPMPVAPMPVAPAPVVPTHAAPTHAAPTHPAATPPAAPGTPAPAIPAAAVPAPPVPAPPVSAPPVSAAAPPAPVVPPATRPATAPSTPPAPVGPAPVAAAPSASVVRCKPLGPGDPQAVGRYRLLGRIGAGGMGSVYLAQRQGAATQVALKTLRPELMEDGDLLLRFEREAEVLARVPSAYTARVLDTGAVDGIPFIAMELLDGRPLSTHLAEQGPFRDGAALRALALALAEALGAVHGEGLVHRDLKPANVMLTSDGPKLLDFGIAMMVDRTRLTQFGGGPGTLTYMAPEQFGEGPVDARADLWAWACCVAAAAHGASPFEGTSAMAVMRKIVDLGPDPAALDAVRALDPVLADLVVQALQPDPAARPQSAPALAASLAAADPAGRAAAAQIEDGWRTQLRLSIIHI